MEWVEASGKSLAEAKETVLDMLGVAEDDAEFVVLSEPKAGLFGRLRGEARVQARVRPVAPPPKRARRPRPDKKREGGDRSGPKGSGQGQEAGCGRSGRGQHADGDGAVDRADGPAPQPSDGGGPSGGNRTEPVTWRTRYRRTDQTERQANVRTFVRR